VTIVAAVYVLLMLGGTIPSPLYPIYQSKLHFGALTVTVVFAGYAVGILLTLVVVGRGSDVAGRRPLLLASLGAALLSTVAFLFPDSVGDLFAGRVLSGISVGIATSTATPYLLELWPGARQQASVLATGAVMGGLSLGPLLSGMLARFAPEPLYLVYFVFLGLVLLAVLLIIPAPETVAGARAGAVRPRWPSVPPAMAGQFTRAAIGGFAGFTVLGLLSALTPTYLAKRLHDPDHALAGAALFLLFAAGMAAQVLLRNRAGPGLAAVGLVLVPVSLALLLVALQTSSLVSLLLSELVGGAGAGLAFLGSLGSVNLAAPPDRRADVAAAYFAAAYLGLSFPVIGTGLATDAWGATAAALVLAIVIGVVSIGTAAVLVKFRG